MKNRKVAIIGWHEGMAGQLHSFLNQDDIHIDCFVCETEKPPVVYPVKRKSKNFSCPENGTFKGLPLIATVDWVDVLLQRGVSAVYIAVYDPVLRERVFNAASAKLEVLSYIHSSSLILPEAVIGKGCLLLAGAVLGYRAEIGNCVVLNTRSQVDHHSVLEDYTTIQPSATLCGNVCVCKKAIVGASATIVQRVTVGEGAFVGAGALVRHDVESYMQVVGVPARVLKKVNGVL